MKFPETIIVRRAPLVADAKGNLRRDWTAAVDTPAVADVQQIGSTEDVARQQRTETRYDVFAPLITDVLVTDRIVWRGGTHEVVGDPFRWDQGSPRTRHVALVMRRITGG